MILLIWKLFFIFILSSLDYCNSLFTCLNKPSLEHLQVVQYITALLTVLSGLIWTSAVNLCSTYNITYREIKETKLSQQWPPL